MDFCNDCGSKTDPEWVFCRSCGSTLERSATETAEQAVVAGPDAPKVELISRGWDVVEVDTVDLPGDPLADDEVQVPLPPGAVEVTVDEVTVVATPAAEPDEAEAEPDEGAFEPEPEEPALETDSWDHLRPHGSIPGVTEPTTAPARIGQVGVLLVALGAVAAAALHFYLNTRLDGFRQGRISAGAVDNARLAADISLLVVAGLAVVAALILLWWVIKARGHASFRPGGIETLALTAGLGGAVLIGVFVYLDQDSINGEIAANSLVILGLGLLMLAASAVVRSVQRIEFRDRK